MNNALLAELAALPKLHINEVKRRWEDVFQSKPPVYNREYLTTRLAYRMQEIAWEGDIAKLNARMNAMVKTHLSDDLKQARKAKINRPPAGTKLVRDFKGVEYHVTVLPDGFAFDGRKYKSLSRISQLITGMSWSGPEFFGLTTRRKKS